MKQLLFVFLCLFVAAGLSGAPPSVEGPYDEITGAMTTLDIAHSEIHEGLHYFYHDSVELASTASKSYLITTTATNTYIHFLMDLDGSAITTFALYEATDRIGSGTPATPLNSNRPFATLATSTVTIFPAIGGGTTDGTLLWTYKSGSASAQSKAPTSSQRENELILKPLTKYIVRVTSGTASNLCNVGMFWYELTRPSN